MDGIGQPHYAASPTRPSHCCHASIPDNVTFSHNDNVLSQCGIVALKGGCVNGWACHLEWNRTTSQISGFWHTSEKPVFEIAISTAQLLTPLLLSSIPLLFTILPWTNTLVLLWCLYLPIFALQLSVNMSTPIAVLPYYKYVQPDPWLRRRFYEIYWLVETIASVKGTVSTETVSCYWKNYYKGQSENYSPHILGSTFSPPIRTVHMQLYCHLIPFLTVSELNTQSNQMSSSYAE
jgi:hypothetical protein